MITYTFRDNSIPLYEQLTSLLKQDIESGVLRADEKLPSKRSLAKNLGVSVITVEAAYGQLIGEGYIYSQEKKGYYVTDIREYLPGGFTEAGDFKVGASETEEMKKRNDRSVEQKEAFPVRWDLSGNRVSPDRFPFSVWNKLMRRNMSERSEALLAPSFPTGVIELRKALAGHLGSFRGMQVDPDQIVVGAGTEYLYSLILQLLGRDKVYGLENPGYKKAAQIYEMSGAVCRFAGMDESGILPDELAATGADVAHISPNHHFPTGITMPVKRRHEILQWAAEKEGRYILEDDYDSEFRLSGKPAPTLFSMDRGEKVIYINTFSKSLSPAIRVAYMVLPPHLAARFYDTLLFYSCTVPNFLQYTLADFVAEGYFERHINRMRLYYAGKRREVLAILASSGLGERADVQEEGSGLHFTLRLWTERSDEELAESLLKRGVRMTPLSEYDHLGKSQYTHTFLMNYSNVNTETLAEGFAEIRRELEGE